MAKRLGEYSEIGCNDGVISERGVRPDLGDDQRLHALERMRVSVKPPRRPPMRMSLSARSTYRGSRSIIRIICGAGQLL